MEQIITLHFANIALRFFLAHEVSIDKTLQRFAAENDTPADVSVSVSWDWSTRTVPTVPLAAETVLHDYYIEPDCVICEQRGGTKGATASCRCTPDFSRIHCVVHKAVYPYIPYKLDWVARALPLCAILQKNGALYFHAAEIVMDGKGILFTAPSETGKTTQAKLWEQYRGAARVCADRALVRRDTGGWQTFSCPMDGSEPIAIPGSWPLGAVVRLKQGKENTVRRLTGRHAIAELMPQLVIDAWSPRARVTASEQLAALLADVPVYLLTCTPDAGAVEALERQLQQDGVLI